MMDGSDTARQPDSLATELAGGDELRAEQAPLAAAEGLLRGDNPDVPEGFVASLFSHAVPEDLMQLDPRQIAALGVGAWSLLSRRQPRAPLIRFETAPAMAGPGEPRRSLNPEVVHDR